MMCMIIARIKPIHCGVQQMPFVDYIGAVVGSSSSTCLQVFAPCLLWHYHALSDKLLLSYDVPLRDSGLTSLRSSK